jgi:ArsR family transcriptional regulator
MKRDGRDIKHITRLLAALTDPTRLRLIRLLQQQELCVCELVDALQVPQYKVSRHLRLLRATGIVEARRDGRWMHYRINPRGEPIGLHRSLLKALNDYMGTVPEAKRDDARLSRRLRLRWEGQCIVGTTGSCASGGMTQGAAGRIGPRPAEKRRNFRTVQPRSGR